ncbi:hypothetical protein ZWY2020_037767 [Hordeum vulgare]|nr:hypothetical protein ZWY2020_037767 [Hordeum vulgare]
MEAVRGVESLAGGDGRHHVSRTLGTALLISVGYIDLGKWVAAVDAGTRFGYDLVLLVLFFNFSAVLNQYLCTCIGMVTGKNLAESSGAMPPERFAGSPSLPNADVQNIGVNGVKLHFLESC